jgi:hypothetical protein
VTLPETVVISIMCGGNFDRAGTEFRVYQLGIGYYGKGEGGNKRMADELVVEVLDKR